MKADFEFNSPTPCILEELAKTRGPARRAKRKKGGFSNRTCRLCGKDPHPNYFYCPVCHHRISASGADEFGEFPEPE
jgi:hypothetical protein